MKDFKKIRLVLNSVLPAVILYEWLNMFFFANGNLLSSRGLQSLKYFTILSNLLEAFACLWWLFRRNEVLKFTASVAVMLTCIVVLVFLGPMFGYRAMFAGPNLWFHLLVPLTALAEVLFLVNRTYSKKEIFLASLTMAVYGIFYLGNILINGIGQRPASNDWYGFLTWGYPVGVLIYFTIWGTTYLIGAFISFINDLYDRRHS
ncbi:MAG: hypothetical protein IIZ28_02305 [Erysipelotrichaceae bacterium]|nr:hypothetical protein [Erysipelotrichaceae bacterium]MBQ1482382.1 hypothetical protein [Erysipelotrichaceae bacterium]